MGKSFIFGLLLCAAAALPVSAQVNVLTYHNDAARTGQNLLETALTPAAVSTSFHKLLTYAVDGAVYAQPLYVSNVAVPGKGAHNLVFVATEHDSVYALDADSQDGANGAPLWHTSFLNAAAGITTVPSATLGCGQISPEIGITGTPVIDGASGTLYLVAMTLENGSYFHRLHALDITTGAEQAGSPVIVQASVPGTGEGGTTLVFNPKNYKERPGLALVNGIVYTSWSSHCDIGKYHGWIMGYDAATLRQVSVYNDTPNGNEGSFWAGGAAPAVDAQGNLYVVSGNGTFDANAGGTDLGESFLKLSTTGGLAVTDYFTPFNQAALNAADLDTGSSGALLLPDSAGSSTHPHLLVSAGKEGRIYLIDRDQLGHYQSGSDSQIVQSLIGAIKPLFGIPAYFNNAVYFAGSGDSLKAFSVQNAQLSQSAVSKSSAVFSFPGGVPSISANGTANAIVWLIDPTGTGALRAYNASDVSQQLYTSTSLAGDALGSAVKFSAPTIADGKVFVGTQNALLVFGLSQPAGTSATATNAASFIAGPVAPGSLISLFGQFTFDTAPAPASVFINGVRAPVLYAGAAQVNVQVPFETPVGQVNVVVSKAGTAIASTTLNVAAYAPGLFLIGVNQAAVVNQDGTINGPDHPASVGSLVSAYLTGQGAVSPSVATGAPAPAQPLAFVTNQVTATVGGQTADVQFAGLAPGEIGVFQTNLKIPSLPAGQNSLIVKVGGAASNQAAIWITTPPPKPTAARLPAVK